MLELDGWMGTGEETRPPPRLALLRFDGSEYGQQGPKHLVTRGVSELRWHITDTLE